MLTALLLAATVTISATPKISVASPGHPTVITVRVVIENADEKLWCPAVRWYSPDTTEAYEESDCDPFTEADPGAIKHTSWSRKYGVPPGQYQFCVGLEKNKKTIKKLCDTVTVGGGE